MKYAKPEYERRFLAAPNLPLRNNWKQIKDLYLDGTRMRLRSVYSQSGECIQRKLTQKKDTDSGKVITNIYLNECEFKQLSTLGGKPLHKKRYRIPELGESWCIDVFDDKLEGLVLIEYEVYSEEDLNLEILPDIVGTEVTDDNFFTGGNLIDVNNSELKFKLSTTIRG